MKMNENGNEKCFLLFVSVFGRYVFPFAVRCFLLLPGCSSLLVLVFEIESVLSQKPKQANAFGCSFLLFVVPFGFL